MRPTDVLLVQDSFRRLLPVSDQAAALFFARLFELEPDLREFFGGDIAVQGRKFMTLLGGVIAGLDQIDSLLPTVRRLGARHTRHDFDEQHYAAVGAALLWTLEKSLGRNFNSATREAWTDTYSLLANTMIGARHEAVMKN